MDFGLLEEFFPRKRWGQQHDTLRRASALWSWSIRDHKICPNNFPLPPYLPRNLSLPPYLPADLRKDITIVSFPLIVVPLFVLPLTFRRDYRNKKSLWTSGATGGGARNIATKSSALCERFRCWLEDEAEAGTLGVLEGMAVERLPCL